MMSQRAKNGLSDNCRPSRVYSPMSGCGVVAWRPPPDDHWHSPAVLTLVRRSHSEADATASLWESLVLLFSTTWPRLQLWKSGSLKKRCWSYCPKQSGGLWRIPRNYTGDIKKKEEAGRCCEGENKPVQRNQKSFLRGEQREISEVLKGSRTTSTSAREAPCFTHKPSASSVHQSRVKRLFSLCCSRGRMWRRRHFWSGDIAGDAMEKLKDDWLSTAHTMCDLSPGDTAVSLSELYGNKKQLSKCHSVTSTMDGCRVVGHRDESLVWHNGQQLSWTLDGLGEGLVESVSREQVKVERWLDNACVEWPILCSGLLIFFMSSFLEPNYKIWRAVYAFSSIIYL